MNGKFSITARLKPRPIFEIRWIKERWRSRILFGIGFDCSSIYLCIRPFILTLSKIKSIKPTPLSKEEQRLFEELSQADQD